MTQTIEGQLLSAVRNLSQDIRNNSEAMLGQYGSTFDDSGVSVTAPAEHVIVAISFLGVINLAELVAADNPLGAAFKSFGTASAGGGTGGVVIDANNKFASGSTIYGRWESVKVNGATTGAGQGIIIYFGK